MASRPSPLAATLAATLALALAACDDASDPAGQTLDAAAPDAAAPDAAAPDATPLDAAAPDAGASPALRAALDQIAADALSTHAHVGLGVTVVLADGSIVEVSAGREAPSPSAPAYTADGSAQVIGSVTKMYTATLVLRLVERGALGLDDPIDAWFDFAGAEQITVRMLLDHTSGLADCLALIEPARRGEPWSPDALIALATAAEPYAPPGGETAWYANTNFVLLARIVEAIGGQTWPEAIAGEIAAPLGFARTGYAGEPARAGAFVDGWYRDGEGWSPALDMIDASTGWGMGALVATNRELARFGAALYAGQLFDDPATLAEMRAPSAPLADALLTPGEPPQVMGLGVIRYAVGDRVLEGHFGQTLGYQAALFRDSVTGAIIAVTANTDGATVGFIALDVAAAIEAAAAL